MRNPNIENKYNLKPEDIKRAVILDPKRLKEKPFWRNEVVHAWCLSGNTVNSKADWEYGTYSSYWIGFYDNPAENESRIGLSISCLGDMCNYGIEEFFKDEDIENEDDLKIQELLLERINWLIDEKIIAIP